MCCFLFLYFSFWVFLLGVTRRVFIHLMEMIVFFLVMFFFWSVIFFIRKHNQKEGKEMPWTPTKQQAYQTLHILTPNTFAFLCPQTWYIAAVKISLTKELEAEVKLQFWMIHLNSWVKPIGFLLHTYPTSTAISNKKKGKRETSDHDFPLLRKCYRHNFIKGLLHRCIT